MIHPEEQQDADIERGSRFLSGCLFAGAALFWIALATAAVCVALI